MQFTYDFGSAIHDSCSPPRVFPGRYDVLMLANSNANPISGGNPVLDAPTALAAPMTEDERYELVRKKEEQLESEYQATGIGPRELPRQMAFNLVSFFYGARSLGMAPNTCQYAGGGFYEHGQGPSRFSGSPIGIGGETRITGVTMLRFNQAMRFNKVPMSATIEGIQPHYFKNMTVDRMTRDQLIYFDKAPQWIMSEQSGIPDAFKQQNKGCLFRDCDGRRKAFVVDVDGSLMGIGPETSILARSDYLTETVNSGLGGAIPPYVPSKYFIPSKMLYDPCPAGNDPWDPTCDMSQWEEYSNGAQNFNYRRRMLDAKYGLDGNTTLGLTPAQSLERLRAAILDKSLQHWAMRQKHGEAQRARMREERRLDEERLGKLTEGAHGNESLRASELGASARRGRQLQRRQLLSARLGDWRTRMCHFPGDERETFYAGQTGRMCPPDAAIFDPSCRTHRRTHREVAYNGYGVCMLRAVELASCPAAASRALPVALCSRPDSLIALRRPQGLRLQRDVQCLHLHAQAAAAGASRRRPHGAASLWGAPAVHPSHVRNQRLRRLPQRRLLARPSVQHDRRHQPHVNELNHGPSAASPTCNLPPAALPRLAFDDILLPRARLGTTWP